MDPLQPQVQNQNLQAAQQPQIQNPQNNLPAKPLDTTTAPPANDRKTKITSLIKPVLILIASISLGLVILFFILNFFNIIRLYSLYPNQFGPLPHLVPTPEFLPNPPKSPTSSSTPVPIPTIMLTKATTVSAVSDFSGYSVSIANEQFLNNLLGKFNIWGRIFSGFGSQQPLYSISFHLTNQKGNVDGIFLDYTTKEPIYYSTYSFSGENLDLYIYINPVILATDDASYLFDLAAVSDTYSLSPAAPVSTSIKKDSIIKYLKPVGSGTTDLFKVVKTSK